MQNSNLYWNEIDARIIQIYSDFYEIETVTELEAILIQAYADLDED